ncbi:hypothetical protein SAMN05192574_11053 [Mucilaginibacter gossypiicola]|uniref:Uncharacterized protein n=1 Tax=Mucilaginibacter gossypiicola TaxID=551995 RepID=A0A1H8R9K2_9SPHI|nr:hypothetical protein SAMN05192574_11053 [Mucilaginibacter gossypiicola]
MVFDLKITLSSFYYNVAPDQTYEHNIKYQEEYWQHYRWFVDACEERVLKICKEFRTQFGAM